jgi:tetratricopeptide (TPR) repeat protein
MGYPHGLEAALAFSWARLDGEAARGLALRLGLYGAAAIPLTEDELQDWQEALTGLLNLNLLEGEGNLVRLHPLVRQFVRQRLAVELSAEGVDELRREVAGAIVEQGKRIPYSFTMAQAREFAPWIAHLEEVAGELLAWVGDEDVIWPLTSIASYYQGQGLYGAAQPWNEQCVEVARERLGNQHPDTASSLNNLAWLYGAQGKYEEAKPLFLEALAIIRESLPPNHPHLATHLNNLAGLYESQGKYGEAEPLYLEALAIDRESLPPNHPQLATHLNNLALLYESQGKYGEAEPLYLEAMGICWESLGEDHPNTQTVLNNVIDFYRTALAAGLPDSRLRQHPLGDQIRSRL